MATIYEAQKKYYKKNKKYTSEVSKIKKSFQCPENVKITLTKLQDNRFIAIGKFPNDLWVINEDKYLIKGNL